MYWAPFLKIVSLNDLNECIRVKEALEVNGCDSAKIKFACFDSDYIELFSDHRTEFIKDYALWCEQKKIKGNVAECSVFVGDSAKFINRYFNNRKLYLFDTFDGFDVKDLDFEDEIGYTLSKMPIGDHISLAIIK